MKHQYNNNIVLAFSNGEGVLLNKDSKMGEIGEYTKDWIDFNNADFWESFNGKIILEND
jgi:hypothetical protein